MDVLLEHTDDDGEITVTNGVVAMDDTGLRTSVYLSLFGGDSDDDGGPTTDKQWWGNLDEQDPAYKYRSVTQYLLKTSPATTASLVKIRDAIKKDLAWLDADVVVTLTLPALNRLGITVDFGVRGKYTLIAPFGDIYTTPEQPAQGTDAVAVRNAVVAAGGAVADWDALNDAWTAFNAVATEPKWFDSLSHADEWFTALEETTTAIKTVTEVQSLTTPSGVYPAYGASGCTLMKNGLVFIAPYITGTVARTYDRNTNTTIELGYTVVGDLENWKVANLSDGRVFMLYGDKGMVYNPSNGTFTTIPSLVGELSDVRSVDLLQDGRIFILGEVNAWIYDVDLDILTVATVEAISLEGAIHCLVLPNNKIFIVGYYGATWIYDVTSDTLSTALGDFSELNIQTMSLLDTTHILMVDGLYTIIYNVVTGAMVTSTTENTFVAGALSRLPDGRFLLGGYEGTLKIYDAESDTLTDSVAELSFPINNLIHLPNGAVYATFENSADGAIFSTGRPALRPSQYLSPFIN
jgi:hypothetical protein